MTEPIQNGFLRRIVKQAADAPPVLVAYAIFVAVVTLAEFLVLPFAGKSLRSHLVPYTGWLACMPYLFSIYFAFALILIPERRWRWGMRLGIVLTILVNVAFSASSISEIGAENFHNPWLTVSPWQPVWTMLIPCAWIAALFSPRMNRFCRRTLPSLPL